MANYSFNRNHAIEAIVVGGTPMAIDTCRACAAGANGGIESRNASYQSVGSSQSSNREI